MDLEVISRPTVQDIIDDAKEKLTELRMNLLEVKWLVKNLGEVSKPLEENAVSSAKLDFQLDVEPAAPIDIDNLMANSSVGTQHSPASSTDSPNKADSISKRPRKWWCFRKNKPRVLSDTSKSGKQGRSIRKKELKKREKSKLCAVGKNAVSTESEPKLQSLDQFESERNHQQFISLKRKDDDNSTTIITTTVTLMDEILKEIPQFG